MEMSPEKLEFIQKNAPCYLYDKNQIIEQCKLLRSFLPDEIILYSVKTNPFAPVLQSIAARGFGADAASANEVLRAVNTGIKADRIFYSAPGKTIEDIEKVWGKCIVIADSFSELDMLESYGEARNEEIHVGIRVNPAFSMNGSIAGPSKFGVDEERITPETVNFPHLKIVGIHVHLQSQILDTDMLCEYYRNCYALAERINGRVNGEISFINFGSGLGTVYDASKEKALDLEKIGKIMQELQHRNQQSLHARFIVETGRFLVCNAGTYYTKVVDRKESRGKTYIVVQNALNGFLRPAIAELLRQNLGEFPRVGQEPLYTSAGQCSFHILGKEADVEKVDVVGNLCTSLDVMAKDILLPHAVKGDVLEVTNAGSYGCTLTPQLFSGQEAAREFLWEE